MKLFGFEIARTKNYLAPVDSRGWWPFINEPYSGAWQNNDSWTIDNVLANPTVYACATLIANDVSKLPFGYVRETQAGIWAKAKNESLMRLLRNPNRYQNEKQFRQWWMLSRLVRGNVYVLKERTISGEVSGLYILDPQKVTVQVAPDGSVFYQLAQDRLNDQTEASVTVPASEIIHDRLNPLFHPLVGVSPLFASGLSASGGLKIINDSKYFFENGAKNSGVLTAPGQISDETAARLKQHWDENYTGTNSGKVAVLGDSLKFEPMRMTSVDAQLIEQLKWTAEAICSTFSVPAYKVGAAPAPSYNNIESLNQGYYSDCLQNHIEDMEASLNGGLGLVPTESVQLNLEMLFRMDTKTQLETLKIGVEGAIYTPNEARKQRNLPPLDGGDTVYMQQQDYSMQALAWRDSQSNPFDPAAKSEAPAEPQEPPEEMQNSYLAYCVEKELTDILEAA